MGQSPPSAEIGSHRFPGGSCDVDNCTREEVPHTRHLAALEDRLSCAAIKTEKQIDQSDVAKHKVLLS